MLRSALLACLFLAGCAPVSSGSEELSDDPAEGAGPGFVWVDADGVVQDRIVGMPPRGYVDEVYGAWWRIVLGPEGWTVEPAGTLSHEVGVGLLYADADCMGEVFLDVGRTGYSFVYEPVDGAPSETRVIPRDAEPETIFAYTETLDHLRCLPDGEHHALPLSATELATAPVLDVAEPLHLEPR